MFSQKGQWLSCDRCPTRSRCWVPAPGRPGAELPHVPGDPRATRTCCRGRAGSRPPAAPPWQKAMSVALHGQRGQAWVAVAGGAIRGVIFRAPGAMLV